MKQRLKDLLSGILALVVIFGIWMGANELQGFNQPWEATESRGGYSCPVPPAQCNPPQATPVMTHP